MILHLINRAPQHPAVYQALAESFSKGDHVLLVEDACYAALPGRQDVLAPFAGAVSALEEDLVSRGLRERVGDSLEVVDMVGFVSLTELYSRSLSWF